MVITECSMDDRVNCLRNLSQEDILDCLFKSRAKHNHFCRLIMNVTAGGYVEWHILLVLRKHHTVFAEGVGNTKLVKNIRVSSGHVGNNKFGNTYGFPNVFHDFTGSEDLTRMYSP